MSRNQTKPLLYGQRLILALTWSGWIAHESTMTHTVFVREDYARTADSGGLRRLFIGNRSGHIFAGDSWGHATPMPLDWAERLIRKWEATVAHGGDGRTSSAAAPCVRALAGMEEFGL
jgi:hypothetical protein